MSASAKAGSTQRGQTPCVGDTPCVKAAESRRVGV